MWYRVTVAGAGIGSLSLARARKGLLCLTRVGIDLLSLSSAVIGLLIIIGLFRTMFYINILNVYRNSDLK